MIRFGLILVRDRLAWVVAGAIMGGACAILAFWFWLVTTKRDREVWQQPALTAVTPQAPTPRLIAPRHYLDLCLADIVHDPILKGKFDLEHLDLVTLVSDKKTAWPVGYQPRPLPHFKTVCFDWRTDTPPKPLPRSLAVELTMVHREKDSLYLSFSVYLQSEGEEIGPLGSLLSYDLEQVDGEWKIRAMEHKR